MAATNVTANYGLPQWLPTDKPSWLGDLNAAFLAIDLGIAGGLAASEAYAAAIAANAAAIDLTEADIAALDARLDTEEAGLAAAQGTIVAHTNSLAAQGDRLGTAEGKVTSLEAADIAHTASIAAAAAAALAAQNDADAAAGLDAETRLLMANGWVSFSPVLPANMLGEIKFLYNNTLHMFKLYGNISCTVDIPAFNITLPAGFVAPLVNQTLKGRVQYFNASSQNAGFVDVVLTTGKVIAMLAMGPSYGRYQCRLDETIDFVWQEAL